MADVSDPRRPDDRSDDRGSALALTAAEVAGQSGNGNAMEMLRAFATEAACARRYWRQTFQTSSPSLLASIAEEEAIKAKHAGGRT